MEENLQARIVLRTVRCGSLFLTKAGVVYLILKNTDNPIFGPAITLCTSTREESVQTVSSLSSRQILDHVMLPPPQVTLPKPQIITVIKKGIRSCQAY